MVAVEGVPMRGKDEDNMKQRNNNHKNNNKEGDEEILCCPIDESRRVNGSHNLSNDVT